MEKFSKEKVLKKEQPSSLFRRLTLYLIMALSLMAFVTGCTGDTTSTDGKKDAGKKPHVVVTTGFLADMTEVLAKDFVDIDLIMPAGSDPHLYVAKPEDYEKIKKADLLLYHGLHFEGKMAETLEKTGVAVSKTFAKDKLLTMEEDNEVITDPHFWFDVDLYKEATKNAAEALIKLVPTHKEEIEKNLKAYEQELDKLKKESKEKIASIPKDSRYLITPHDAFQYFSRTFDIEVMAPQGVSTESEVSNKDLLNTADFIVEHKIKAIFAESTTDPKRMEKIKESCKAKGFDVEVVSGENKELFSDSLANKGEKGDTYLSMVRHNVDLIVKYLKP